ncbi:hypothetical protein ASD39_03640 [Sphingomonas sp. Root50]|nr:hypothetical protein ASD17_02430 [Sphingomonas sp. Root1294]KQY69391.1 hypothetical protein ASD39_03640 [Sphingomonas sp. Root50]KRB89649.1 hypothetical protein ASE22_18550 [Sphingomonas sp. Root720]
MGDKGNDVLSGGRGYDLFTGGEGSDVFRFDDPRDASAVAAEFTTTGPDAYRVDIVTDFHHGEDHLAFSTPQNILVGAATDAQAAATLAQTLLDNNPGDSETAAIGVGHDTYLFFHLNSSTVQAAVLLIGVNPGEITASDFGF